MIMFYLIFLLLKARDDKLRRNRVIGHVVEHTDNQGTYIATMSALFIHGTNTCFTNQQCLWQKFITLFSQS